MKYEIPLDRKGLIASIHHQYGLEVVRLDFVPQGEVGQHYRATCADQRVFFLTLLGDNRLARLGAARLDFYLSLTSELYEQGLFRQLAPPIRTLAGDLKIAFEGQPVILYRDIPGQNLMENPIFPTDLPQRTAALIANLHEVTPHLQLKIPYIEEFTLPFEQALIEGLAALEKIGKLNRSGRLALRDLLLPNQELIRGLLGRLHRLAEQADRLQSDLVVCHTDANLANLILEDGGELFLVDWEGAMLAPAEHDLFIFTGDGFSEFLRYYRQARPRVKLSAVLFAFYFYRRNLEDLTDWIVRILYENTLDEQDQHDLAGVQQDCVAGWPYLEEGIQTIKEQLAESA
jgi:spectinomycin phosphotransferase